MEPKGVFRLVAASKTGGSPEFVGTGSACIPAFVFDVRTLPWLGEGSVLFGAASGLPVPARIPLICRVDVAAAVRSGSSMDCLESAAAGAMSALPCPDFPKESFAAPAGASSMAPKSAPLGEPDWAEAGLEFFHPRRSSLNRTLDVT
jgi:hypothetical protein